MDDKNWTLSVRSKVEGTGESNSWISTTFPKKQMEWLTTAWSDGYGMKVLGEFDTEVVDPNEPIILLAKRIHDRKNPDPKTQDPQKHNGIMVWLTPIPEAGK